VGLEVFARFAGYNLCLEQQHSTQGREVFARFAGYNLCLALPIKLEQDKSEISPEIQKAACAYMQACRVAAFVF
jgi:hypothetical protein